MNFLTVVGIAGALTSASMFVPDAVRVWRLRAFPEELLGVSIWGKCIAMLNSALWVIYGCILAQVWLVLPSALNIVTNMITVTVVSRSRREVAPELLS